MLTVNRRQLLGIYTSITILFSASLVFADPTFKEDEARKRTVQIIIGGKIKGAGIILTEKGHILTAMHVIKGCKGGRTKIKRYKQARTFDASVIDQKEHFDLALLLVNEKEKFVPAEIGDSETVRGGDKLHIIGHPSPGGIKKEFEIFSLTAKAVDNYGWILLNGTLHKGNSGGPVFNGFGRLVGIILKRSEYMDEAFCFPINNTNYFLVSNGIILKDGKSKNFLSDIDTINIRLKQYEQIHKWLMSDVNWEAELGYRPVIIEGEREQLTDLIIRYSKRIKEQHTPDGDINVKVFPIIKGNELSVKQLKDRNLYYNENLKAYGSEEISIPNIPGKLEAVIDQLNEARETGYTLSDVEWIVVFIKAKNRERTIKFPAKKIKIAYK